MGLHSLCGEVHILNIEQEENWSCHELPTGFLLSHTHIEEMPVHPRNRSSRRSASMRIVMLLLAIVVQSLHAL